MPVMSQRKLEVAMSLQDLDKSKLKLILKTSQGFATQFESSKAMVKITDGVKHISPSRAGHAISSHVRGAAATGVKTKFCSIDDMASALEMLLKTLSGHQALNRLAAGRRERVETDINRVFRIEAVVDGIGTVTFNDRDLAAAHIHRTRCLAILEGRSRSRELYLHVQTFYPVVNPTQIQQLFDAKTSP
jgi:hypothetical protein